MHFIGYLQIYHKSEMTLVFSLCIVITNKIIAICVIGIMYTKMNEINEYLCACKKLKFETKILMESKYKNGTKRAILSQVHCQTILAIPSHKASVQADNLDYIRFIIYFSNAEIRHPFNEILKGISLTDCKYKSMPDYQ